MAKRRTRDEADENRGGADTQTGSQESPDVGAQGFTGVSQPDMNRDPLAGAMGQDSLQDDTLQDATAPEDTGLPAKDDAAPPAGPGSRNTSAPAGAQIGADSPPGAVAGNGSPTCPPDYPIKADQKSMQFHSPGGSTFNDIIPTWCFASEADALNAGYSEPDQ